MKNNSAHYKDVILIMEDTLKDINLFFFFLFSFSHIHKTLELLEFC